MSARGRAIFPPCRADRRGAWGAGARSPASPPNRGGCTRAADLVLHIPAQTMARDQGAVTSVLPMGSLLRRCAIPDFRVADPCAADHLGVHARRDAGAATPIWSRAWAGRSGFSLAGRKGACHRGSKGIGAEICAVFAEAGADVVALGRDEADLAATAAAVEAHGRRCLTLVAEMASPTEHVAACERALAAWGRSTSS